MDSRLVTIVSAMIIAGAVLWHSVYGMASSLSIGELLQWGNLRETYYFVLPIWNMWAGLMWALPIVGGIALSPIHQKDECRGVLKG